MLAARWNWCTLFIQFSPMTLCSRISTRYLDLKNYERTTQHGSATSHLHSHKLNVNVIPKINLFLIQCIRTWDLPSAYQENKETYNSEWNTDKPLGECLFLTGSLYTVTIVTKTSIFFFFLGSPAIFRLAIIGLQ